MSIILDKSIFSRRSKSILSMFTVNSSSSRHWLLGFTTRFQWFTSDIPLGRCSRRRNFIPEICFYAGLQIVSCEWSIVDVAVWVRATRHVNGHHEGSHGVYGISKERFESLFTNVFFIGSILEQLSDCGIPLKIFKRTKDELENKQLWKEFFEEIKSIVSHLFSYYTDLECHGSHAQGHL